MLTVTVAVIVFLSGAIVLNTANAAAFFGAIYTSLGDGTAVNFNIYSSKADVYLNGGPQNANANGLPDGVYYFQVTDPSGAQLLSSDPAECRQLNVSNGVVFGHAQASVDAGCEHANGALNEANGSMPVQLIPFDDTPNAGGEYKVWLIRQTADTTIDEEDDKVIHFMNRDAKTDNFKVQETPECPDPENPVCDPDPVTYDISGEKFFDINGDGIKNGDDFVLEGFRIRSLFDPDLGSPNENPVLRLTDEDGLWSVLGIPDLTDFWVTEDIPGTCETDPAGSYWQQTFPTELITLPDETEVAGYAGTIQGLDVTDLDFGNRCIGEGVGGKTLGFWSNRNGQKLITAPDLTMLAGLNLVNADGTAFNPDPYAQFRTWILGANATNMAYMLSAQYAAASLNVFNGFIDGDALLDVGGEIGTLNGWFEEAETTLGANSETFSGHEERADQERLKNIFDAVNNNQFLFIYVDCGVCYAPEE